MNVNLINDLALVQSETGGIPLQRITLDDKTLKTKKEDDSTNGGGAYDGNVGAFNE